MGSNRAGYGTVFGDGAGGAGGFAPGPLDNAFGTASGSQLTLSSLTPAADKSAAASVRDAYDTANSGWIDGYTDLLVSIALYYTSGSNRVVQYQRRVGSNWVDIGLPVVAVQGRDGVVDLTGVNSYELVMPDASGSATASGIRRLDSGTGNFEADATMVFPRDSIQIGYAGVLSGFGSLIKGRSFVTGRTFVHPFQYYDLTSGSLRAVDLGFGAPSVVEEQPVFTETVPNSGTISVPATPPDNSVSFDLRLRTNASASITGLRFSLTVQGQTEPFFYYPGQAEFAAGTGEDLTAGSDGILTIDVSDAPIFLLENPTISVTYAIDSGVLLGNASNIPYLAFNNSEVTLNNLARTSEVDAKEDSLGNPSSDGQVLSSTAAGVRSWTDQQTGSITVQDEGSELTGGAETLNFTGSGVTASGSGATKTINIPGAAASSVPVQDDGVQVAASPTAINFTGDGVTVSDVGGVATVNIPGGTAPPAPTNQYKVFTRADDTVSEAIINAVSDEGTSLPYRYILVGPLQYMTVAWHSSTDVTDIHVNVLEAAETVDDIVTSPLGNRFLRSAVQTVGVFEYQTLDIAADIALLTTGQKLGIYVG